MAVDAALGAVVEFGTPRNLFAARQTSNYVPAPDGQRFLWVDTLDEQAPSPIVVVINAFR